MKLTYGYLKASAIDGEVSMVLQLGYCYWLTWVSWVLAKVGGIILIRDARKQVVASTPRYGKQLRSSDNSIEYIVAKYIEHFQLILVLACLKSFLPTSMRPLI